ncbi:MAG TPA: RNA polymerase sigma factor [Thermoanaerobaculia bacterium]|nr:RNA polymerase sigma factor [Thermoanaerobaculia bacterium]
MPDPAPVRAVPEADHRLQVILAEYGGWLRRTLRKLCPTRRGIQVDDLEQEVAIRIWRSLRDGRGIENPASFLYRVAATATVDAVRRVEARREEPLAAGGEEEEGAAPPQTPGPDPEAAARSAELGRRLREALAALPDNRRRAVALHLQGFNVQEAAELLGWTEAKTRNLIYRGLEDLRRDLGPTQGTLP